MKTNEEVVKGFKEIIPHMRAVDIEDDLIAKAWSFTLNQHVKHSLITEQQLSELSALTPWNDN